jgi:AcrR family transcriptional regulator
MSIVVEHEKRRKQILRKALTVFMEEGYENATYQKIADRCKITRTTLYLYFRNRQEIFNFSIKQFMAEVEQDILGVKEDRSLSSPEKIKKTLFLILSRLEENRLLLSVVLDYLLSKGGKSKNTVTANDRVRRRTIRLRHILSSMLIEGIKKGELIKIDVGAANDLLYGLLESAIFRLSVLDRKSTPELKEAMELAVNGFKL